MAQHVDDFPATAREPTRGTAQRFAQRIRDRLLAPGARLPSVRLCAQQQGVSPSTIMALVKFQGLVLMPVVGFLVGDRMKSLFG